MSYNYRLIYRHNRKQFWELLTKGIPFEEKINRWGMVSGTQSWKVSKSLDRETSPGKLRVWAEERWPLDQLVWKHLVRQINVYLIGIVLVSILEITTKNGKYIIMRNGSNLGDYNYAVLDLPKNKWHWGKNSLEAIEIVELLSATKDNLPLLIGITSPKLLTLLERRLKGL